MPVRIIVEECIGCGACVDVCEQYVLEMEDDVAVVANPEDCIDCYMCVDECPNECIEIEE
ncbi:MAG: ferredoxin family protein [Candidatus Hydrothermarchaeota archaeon]